MALYPLGTLACARLFARERLTPVQALGILLAVAASAELSVAGKH